MRLSLLLFLAALVLLIVQLYNATDPTERKPIAALTEPAALEPKVSLPEPLKLTDHSAHSGDLTVEGILEWTNSMRGQHSLPPLSANELLAQAAQTKVDDLFDREYFAHVSPLGVGPENLLGNVGYIYLLAGENLALGNFKDDQAVVQAWMDSPGHRANILREGFTELGVAVGKGRFEGQEVWIAVQTFGTPDSECDRPPADLIQEIMAANDRINELDQLIDDAEKEQDLGAAEVGGLLDVIEMRNTLAELNNERTEEYNRLTEAFNRCLKRLETR